MKAKSAEHDKEKARKFARSFTRGIKTLKTREEWFAFYQDSFADLRSQLRELGPEHPKQRKRLTMLANSLETLSMSVQRASEIGAVR